MASCRLAERLPGLWFKRALSWRLLPLLPVSWLFSLLVGCRRLLYRLGAARSVRLPVPVIVVGNLTVGGSGKTPLVVWLIERLRERGWNPGVVSRGYGGAGEGARCVDPDSDANVCGDEPLLLARRTGVPVFVGSDRAAAGEALLAAHPECTVLVSDDGLQHYRLRREVELAVFDDRGAGNRRLLPVGPLREPLRRLASVTAVVLNSAPEAMRDDFSHVAPVFSMRLEGRRFQRLGQPEQQCSVEELRGKRLYALAGIGNPERFFSLLQALGLVFEAHPFPDHHRFEGEDFAFAKNGVLLMTEKDAVKCAPWLMSEAWVLPVDAQLEPSIGGVSLIDLIVEKIDGRTLA